MSIKCLWFLLLLVFFCNFSSKLYSDSWILVNWLLVQRWSFSVLRLPSLSVGRVIHYWIWHEIIMQYQSVIRYKKNKQKKKHINPLAQNYIISTVHALEIQQSCTEPLKYSPCLIRMELSPIRKHRVSSSQGKVREIPDLAKVREKSGNFVEGQGKNEYWESQGICI